MSRRNVRFSFLRWIQKTNTVSIGTKNDDWQKNEDAQKYYVTDIRHNTEKDRFEPSNFSVTLKNKDIFWLPECMKPFIFKWPGNLNKVPEEISIKIQLRCAIVLLRFCLRVL